MHKGIDVSHDNGIVDWAKVAEAGITFAFLKATQGDGFVDPLFENNLGGCVDHGIAHGVYHYLTPGDQAADQAAHFLHTIQEKVGQLPPVMDVEATFAFRGGPDLWRALPLEERVEKVVRFGEAVQVATGVSPLLYASPAYIEEVLGSDVRLGQFGLWVAEYEVSAPRVPAPFKRYRCWQYSDSGTVPGAGTGVDLDLWNGPF